MKRKFCMSFVASLVLALAITAPAQETSVDQLTVPLTDPSRPAQLEAGLLNGSITVRGYVGKEVIVEARVRPEKPHEHDKERRGDKAQGMKRIEIMSTGLTVEEENNSVEVSASAMQRTIDLTIQVPVRTSVSLSTVNDGDIKIENVTGEIEVNNTNGAVTISNVSGNVVAHALNGDVVVTFAKVSPEKAMSFSSLNGDLDVTFPAEVRAKLKLKTDNGEVFSDFELRMEPSTQKIEEGSRQEGKYRITLEKTMYGLLNGGGPEIQFSTFNGDIYIRKAK